MREEEFKLRRNWTLANGCLAAFSFGLSLTVYLPTEFYYFRDTMKVSNPDLFYGLGPASLAVSGILSSLLGSYYVDKTKNVREILLWTSAVSVIGNIIYLLHFSPYLVLLGLLLIGTAATRMVCVVGEISRIYESTEVTHKIAYLGIFSTTGTLLGPCLTFLFSLVDTGINDWVLNVNNVVGILMGVLFLVQFGVHYFTITNLSKEYNVKRATKDMSLHGKDKDGIELDQSKAENEAEINEPDPGNNSFWKQYLLALRAMISSKQVMFLYALGFFSSYCRGSVIFLFPIKSALYLGWLQTNQAAWTIISASAGAIPTALILKRLSRSVDDFYLMVYAVATLLLQLTLMAALPVVSDNKGITEVIIYIIGLLYGSSSASFHIMSRSMLAKFVPENVQTVTEAIRNSLFELSYLIAGVGVHLAALYMTEFMITMTVLYTLALSWLLVNSDKFKDIQVIQLDEEDL